MSSSPVSWKAWRRAGAGAATVSSAAWSALGSSAGHSSSRESSPSRRITGGWPSLRCTSLAPSSTACRRRAFRSMPHRRDRQAPEAALATARDAGRELECRPPQRRRRREPREGACGDLGLEERRQELRWHRREQAHLLVPLVVGERREPRVHEPPEAELPREPAPEGPLVGRERLLVGASGLERT